MLVVSRKRKENMERVLKRRRKSLNKSALSSWAPAQSCQDIPRCIIGLFTEEINWWASPPGVRGCWLHLTARYQMFLFLRTSLDLPVESSSVCLFLNNSFLPTQGVTFTFLCFSLICLKTRFMCLYLCPGPKPHQLHGACDLCRYFHLEILTHFGRRVAAFSFYTGLTNYVAGLAWMRHFSVNTVWNKCVVK